MIMMRINCRACRDDRHADCTGEQYEDAIGDWIPCDCAVDDHFGALDDRGPATFTVPPDPWTAAS